MKFVKNIHLSNWKWIWEDYPIFIVAEIWVNHNQNLELAKRLIKAAKEAWADAVKFQTWKTENIILKDVEKAEYQIKNTWTLESQFEMLKKLELPYERHFELKEYAESMWLIFFSTMEDFESVDFLIDDLWIELIKVGSWDLTNLPLLEYTLKKNIPMILSTWVSSEEEIDKVMKVVEKSGNNKIVLLQCTSNYPTELKDVNLLWIEILKKYGTIVWLSNHCLDVVSDIVAVWLGVKYIEKHFTLSRNLPWPDHKASLEPHEFKEFANKVRKAEIALWKKEKKVLNCVKTTKKLIERRLVARVDIKKWEILTLDKLEFKRANKGIFAYDIDKYLWKEVNRDIKKNDIILEEYFN